MNRRDFIKATAGIAAALSLPDWVGNAPAPTPTRSIPLGTFKETAEGFRYIRVRFPQATRIGHWCALTDEWDAPLFTKDTALGRVGIAVADVAPGDDEWVMVRGAHNTAIVNEPWVAIRA